MAGIQLTNHMGDSINLMAGETLSIPGSTQWRNEGYFWVTHVVNSGETLVELAGAYDVTVDEILRVNAIADPDLIRVNQQLVLPLTRLVTLNQQRPTPTTVPAIVQAPNPATPTVPNPVVASEELAAPVVGSPPPQPAGPADWPAYLLTRINQARVENGLQPLSLVAELSQAAQAHATDCAQRGWGSHVGSDGAVLRTRLERVGYNGRNQGENWVQALNAERAFDWWYGEIPPNDPHRRNILSRNYTEIGIGIADSGWGYIFVTDFGRP